MKENKYHMSKSGFLTNCAAEKRACPRGGQHYTQSEYEKLAAENDVRVRPSSSRVANKIAKDKDGYYYKAEQDYTEAMRNADLYKKEYAARKKETARLLRAKGLKEEDEQKYIAERQATISPMTSYARKIYEEEGVSDYKASLIASDMGESKNPDRPLKKKYDSRDPDILAKTTRAAERLKADPEYAKLRNAYKAAASKLTTMAKIHDTTYRNSEARVAAKGGSEGQHWGEPDQRRIAEYKKAKAWLAAEVPASAQLAYVPTLTPNDVSVGKDGNINNAWVEHKDGRVERIVSYAPTSSRGSGQLVTESGAEVSSFTHYHSFTKSVGGHQHIILDAKNGESYPAEAFHLKGQSDSSG